MKSSFFRSLVLSLILVSAFTFAAFGSATKVSAQSLSNCDLIKVLITLGVIPPQNADAALSAFGCANSGGATTTASIVLVSQDISVDSNIGQNDRATGKFRFKVTSLTGDLFIYKAQKDSSTDLLKSGTVIGSPAAVSLTSTQIDTSDTADFYLIKDGATRTFDLNYVIDPIQGGGVVCMQLKQYQLCPLVSLYNLEIMILLD